jgi:hypothetical protein
MFGITETETVTIRRAVAGTLPVNGRPEYAQVFNPDDHTAVLVSCKVAERGRITIDARQRQIKTDATLIYGPEGLATLQDNDIVVRSGGRAYEVVGIETLAGAWGTPPRSRVDLVKTALPATEDRHGG